MEKRDGFTSSKGFILSCIGAAIGLGNIWLFPYRMGENGGAAFLVPYMIFVLVLGSTGLITEFAYGRMSKTGCLAGVKASFKERGLKGGALVGAIPAIGLFGIFMFYNVVVGWILKYLSVSVTGGFKDIDVSTYFDTFTAGSETIAWNAIAIIITLIIVRLGIAKGIEKVNKIIMPAMFVILGVLAIKSLSLPGAMEGVKYLLVPDWSYLLKPMTWVNALGQAFFTVSLTGCAMFVYGSYTNKTFNIPKVAIATAIFDTCAALLSAFVIMPAVFACGLDPAAGPSLLFITVPMIFKLIPGGTILSILFFVSIFFAAISSSVVMLEGPLEAISSQVKVDKKKMAVIVAMVGLVLSIPLNLNMDTFNSFTDFISVILSPTGAWIIMVCFYYVVKKDKALEAINIGATKPLGEKFYNFAKYGFVPIAIFIIGLGIALGGIG